MRGMTGHGCRYTGRIRCKETVIARVVSKLIDQTEMPAGFLLLPMFDGRRKRIRRVILIMRMSGKRKSDMKISMK